MMGRATSTLALALCLSGCAAEPVQLLTGVDSCWAGGESSSGITGVLVPDPSSGTSIDGTPIMWPVGFTGLRLFGGGVEVRDAEGKVLATTGRTYHMSMGRVSGTAATTNIDGAFPAAANCGYPWDFIDCTAAAAAATGELVHGDIYTELGYAARYCGFPESSR